MVGHFVAKQGSLCSPRGRLVASLTESECKKVGLQLNPKKTEVIHYNSSVDTPLKTMEGKELQEVQDFNII